MVDDPKKDLKWLEEQLQEESQDGEFSEDWLEEEKTDWLDDARELLSEDAPRSRKAYDFDAEDEDEATVYAPPKKKAKTKAEKKVKAKKEKGVGGLVFLLLLELVGIAGVVVWWLLWLL